MKPLPSAVGKVSRKLEKTERGGREAWRLTAARVYETTIEDAWDALTNPARIPRWFLPISGDLKVGGRYQFEGNAGGSIERCEPPRLVALTWEMHGEVSWVTVSLEERDGNTRLALEHVAHVPEVLFDEFGPGGVGIGWDLALMGLGLHFESGAPRDPREAEKWAATAEGRSFVEGSSSAWAEASIAAGTDTRKAREAASRVTELYSPRTGQG